MSMRKKQKKVQKMRGSRHHGWGGKKKHRGSGSRGGVGMAGMFKHKKIWAFKNMPGYFGKKGFPTMRMRGIQARRKAINIRDVVKIAEKGKLKELDVCELGFDKVMGAGEISIPLVVKAHFFTESAKEKIAAAGGKAEEV